MSSEVERMSPFPIIPEKCLICGAPWIGGCGVPGKRYPKAGLRVFFRCGASMSVIDKSREFGYEDYYVDDGYCYFLRLKNCNSKDGVYVEGAFGFGPADQPQSENDGGSMGGSGDAEVQSGVDQRTVDGAIV